MKNVIIIGAGGHAAEIYEYLQYNRLRSGIQEHNIIGLLDDNPTNYEKYKFKAPLLGGINEHKIVKGVAYMIGIANLQYRRVFIEKYLSEGAKFLSLIHYSTYVSQTAIIGEGSIIGPNVNIGPNVQIGKFNLVNARSSLGHDTIIGDYNFLSPNVCFSGFTEVGDENLFGINSATIPYIKIGNNNKIAAGMILDTNIGHKNVVFYRFKEKVIAIPK